MTTKSKFFFILAFSFIIVFSQSACTQQKKDNQPKNTENVQKIQEVHSKEASSPGVFELSEVGERTENKLVDFYYKNLDKNFSIKDYAKGKYIFLNFWGTWCPPCRREIPEIIEIQKELKDQLVVIGVALERQPDFESAGKNVSEFVAANGINYLNVVVPSGNPNRMKIAGAYGGIQAVPTTFLIDKDGNIFETIVGGRSKAEFMQSINRMMGKQ
ncbi:MAG: TlpA disulfide reductase family protein [Bacteroidota bacterium]